MRSTIPLLFLFSSSVSGAPRIKSAKEKRLFGPVVKTTFPPASVEGQALPYIGLSAGFVESFKGIPYAHPPVGDLRLKPPQRLTGDVGNIDATTFLPAQCPQFLLGEDITIAGVPGLATSVIETVVDSPLFKNNLVSGQEDCLTVNVQRPAGVKAGDKLPVILWLFGGGFELGGTATYDATHIISGSVAMGKPVVFAAVNYRVGGFGFLGGKEILADGSANLGLLDQRMGMQWVADNIEAFGGDPDKVTLWGESAGSISIFDQMALFDGDITYKGKPLFRGAIMDSGSAVPTNNVDSPKAQAVYDQVVKEAGCSGQSDTLACLRQADYNTLLKAANSVPGILSYNAVALSYIPRPDGKVLTASPEIFAASGKMPKIPFIIGDQEDEGTIFALFQSNLTTTADVEGYLSSLYFQDAGPELISQLVATYPDEPAAGSPFGTGDDNNWYPQYKRLAAMLGDATFTLTRRVVLDIMTKMQPDVPRWSYLASYDKGTPILGTFHASDLVQVFYGIESNFAAKTILNYYVNFAYNLDPNDDSGATVRSTEDGGGLMRWPAWSEPGNMLMNFHADSAELMPDTFRQSSYELLLANAQKLHF